MLESDIIKLYEKGELSGVLLNDDYAYVPMRVTGTGKVGRLDDNGVERIVDRDLAIFTTDEMMKNYANLPIVLNHPKDKDGNFIKAGINTPEYFVGNTIHSYIKDKEVWAIARIYNREVISLMLSNELSTSPHFISKEIQKDDYFVEYPLGLNSLAIVLNGFWDKKSLSRPIEREVINLNDELSEGVEMSENVENKQEQKVDTQETQENKEQKVDTMECESTKADTEDNKEQKVDTENKEKEQAKTQETKADEENKEQAKETKADAEEAPADNTKELVKELIKNEGQEAEKFGELAQEHAKFENQEVDNDLVTGDTFNDDDRTRDELIKVITNMVDSASMLNLQKPFLGAKRYRPHVVIKKFLNANKPFVSDKYKGIINKIDGDSFELGKDILEDMRQNINNKMKELGKPQGSKFEEVNRLTGLSEYRFV